MQSAMSEPAFAHEARARSLPGATVLQIVPALEDTRVARSAIEIAHALLRSGARAIVAGRDGPLVLELQRLGGEWIHLDTDSSNPLRIRAAGRALVDLVTAERVDIVHLRSHGALASAGALRGRSAVWLVASEFERTPSSLRVDRRSKRLLRAASCVLAPSRYAANAYVEQFGIAKNAVVVVPPRIDDKRFDCAAVSLERAAVLRRSWKIMPDERLILAPGRLDPGKGQLNIVEAARVLANGGMKRAVFVLAGDNKSQPDYARAIAEQARMHAVGHLVRQIGACEDMPAAYAAADYVVIPAIEAPLAALSAAEACAMARPVIASGAGALPEIVRAPPLAPDNMRTGWIVKPDHPWALALALATALATEASEYRGIAGRAHELAMALFAPARVAARTLEVYTSLLEGRG